MAMRRLRYLTSLGVVSVVALQGLGGCQPKKADPNAELKTTRLAELAKPATVLIVSNYSASIAVPNVTIPQDRQQLLQQRLAERIQRGELPSDEAQLIRAAVMELLTNWQDYMVAAGGSRNVDAQVTAVGSGFFVTPDGYLVTNAHVVATEGDDLKQGLVENALAKLIDQDVRDFASELGGQPDEEILQKLRKACVEFYVANMNMSNVERTVDVQLSVGVPGVASTQKGMRAEVIPGAMGTPIPGKDVAILKIQGDNLPTLALGDDKALQVGDKIFPLGFPADATFFPAFDPSSISESSLTAGLVSARKQMKEGWEVIQTDAAIRGGNSGGPVLDSKGNVIGLATFGLVDQKTGADAVGVNFVVPMTIVNEFLTRANVKPNQSAVSKLHREALDLMDLHHYKAAKEKLTQIESLKPGQPWVQKARGDSEKAIMDGKDETPGLPMIPILAGGGVVVLGGLAFAFLMGRKGRGPTQLPPAQMPPPPAGPPPQLG